MRSLLHQDYWVLAEERCQRPSTLQQLAGVHSSLRTDLPHLFQEKHTTLLIALSCTTMIGSSEPIIM